MPDRTNMRKLEQIMRLLASVKQDDKRFSAAQARLAEAKELYKGQAAAQASQRATESAVEKRDAQKLEVGQGAAFGLGFARGALGGDAYTQEPENKANARIASDPAYAASLGERQRVEDAALAQHPMTSFAGEVTPDALLALGPGISRGASAALKGVKDFARIPGWLKPAAQVVEQVAPRSVKPGTTVAIAPKAIPRQVPKLKLPEGFETPTFVRRGGKAAKDIASQATKAPAQAPAASGLGAAKATKAAAGAARTELEARARIIMKEGFSHADASEMAAQGTKVLREQLERALGRRLPGTDKWI